MFAMSEMFSVYPRISNDVSESNANVKDEAIIWKITRREPEKTIFVVTPHWVEARQIAQVVLQAERSILEIERCGSYIHPEDIAKRGHEVYVAQYGRETKFIGALKLESK